MKKLRIAFLCAALAMAAFTAAYILENVTAPASAPAPVLHAETGVAAFRTNRDAVRAMEKAQLNDIAHSDGTSEDVRADAQRRLMDLLARQEEETALEGLLTVRGFAGALVSVNGDCVNVLIDAPSVSAREASAILDIVCARTDIECGNVKIIPAG